MKKLSLIIFLTAFILLTPTIIYAQTNQIGEIDFVGTDLTDQQKASDIKVLNNASIVSESNSYTSTKANIKALSSIKITQGDNNLNVKLIQDPQLDVLGYTDFLLTAGLYNANVIIISRNDPLDIIDEIKEAYNSLPNKIDLQNRTSLLQNQWDEYKEINKITANTTRTSNLLHDIIRDIMRGPDLQISSQEIVDNALKSEKIELDKNTKANLYNFAASYIKRNEKSEGFFRNVNLVKKDNTITVNYTSLKSLDKPEPYNPINKIWVFGILLGIISLVIFLSYKRRKLNNK